MGVLNRRTDLAENRVLRERHAPQQISNAIRFENTSNIDAFGRLRVSTPTNLWTSEFQYNKHPLYFDETLVTGGTATHLPNESAVSLAVTTTSGSSAKLQTFEYFRYQPGKSQAIIMTFVADSQQANTDMRIGYFDDENGYFLELTGASTINFVRRTFTSGSVVNNAVARSSWNLDKMDGTGLSGINLDFTKGQILWIDLQWLGMGRIRMGFDVGGVLVYAHEFLIANVLIVPSTTTANLPIRWEIVNTGTGAGVKTLTAICGNVFSEGGVDFDLGHTFGEGNNGTLRTGIGTTHVPICSVRPGLTLNSVTNRVQWRLENIEIFANDAMHYQLIYAPTSITAASWASAATHSATELDIAGTAITGGIAIAGGYIAANNKGSALGSVIKTKFPFMLDAAGTNQSRSFSIVVKTLGGTNKSAAGQFNWVEIR